VFLSDLKVPTKSGDMVLNVSNDEPAIMGETDEQQQLCE
jgi:hypothetical protein